MKTVELNVLVKRKKQKHPPNFNEQFLVLILFIFGTPRPHPIIKIAYSSISKARSPSSCRTLVLVSTPRQGNVHPVILRPLAPAMRPVSFRPLAPATQDCKRALQLLQRQKYFSPSPKTLKMGWLMPKPSPMTLFQLILQGARQTMVTKPWLIQPAKLQTMVRATVEMSI